MCPFKAGDIVRHKTKANSIYWFINDEQYVALEVYEYGEREGHKGLYLSGGATGMLWNGYEKVCTIEKLYSALLTVEL